MTTITAAMVKDLRERTSAGMGDCKQALVETNGDMEAAIEWLRKKGLSKAAKKSDRVAAQGLVGVHASVKSGAVVEVNSETDFVARNPEFQEMVQKIAEMAPAANGDLAKLMGMKMPSGNTVEIEIKEAVGRIGENMGVRRTAALSVKEGVVADYVHSKAADGLGKIGVLVALESAGDTDELLSFGRKLSMHVAGHNPAPLALTSDDLDPADIEKERKFYTEQALASGKPADIVAKMVEGRLKKEFFQQACLMSQVFVLDGKATVAEAVKEAEKAVGAPIKVTGFVRYALGEGIEKKEEDFAAEVAKTVGAAQQPKAEEKPAAPAPAAKAEDKPKTADKPKSGGDKKKKK